MELQLRFRLLADRLEELGLPAGDVDLLPAVKHLREIHTVTSNVCGSSRIFKRKRLLSVVLVSILVVLLCVCAPVVRLVYVAAYSAVVHAFVNFKAVNLDKIQESSVSVGADNFGF